MKDNYGEIQKIYLRKAWGRSLSELEAALPARRVGNGLQISAFGETCQLLPEQIILGGREIIGPTGILIALYASYVPAQEIVWYPLQSFKEFPESLPYQGTFTAQAEKPLQPHVGTIQRNISRIISLFNGQIPAAPPSGDFSFILYPLPRVGIYYIFYLPDEEFPPAISCLFAANALAFLPVAGLADVAEYTAKKIIELIREE